MKLYTLIMLTLMIFSFDSSYARVYRDKCRKQLNREEISYGEYRVCKNNQYHELMLKIEVKILLFNKRTSHKHKKTIRNYQSIWEKAMGRTCSEQEYLIDGTAGGSASVECFFDRALERYNNINRILYSL